MNFDEWFEDFWGQEALNDAKNMTIKELMEFAFDAGKNFGKRKYLASNIEKQNFICPDCGYKVSFEEFVEQ